MGFVTGFVVIYNLRRRVIREPMSIAEYYVRYGTFVPDFLASLPTIAEVCSEHTQYNALVYNEPRIVCTPVAACRQGY